MLTLLIFAFNFRYLPDIRIAWRYVLGGAAVTALLFALGRYLISLYLSFATVGSAYGAAGSLIVVLLWLYYSAQDLLFRRRAHPGRRTQARLPGRCGLTQGVSVLSRTRRILICENWVLTRNNRSAIMSYGVIRKPA